MQRSTFLAAFPTLALTLALALTGSVALAPPAQVAPSAGAAALAPAPDALHAAGVPAAGQKFLEMADRAGQADSAAATLAAVGALPAAGPAAARSPDLASALARLGSGAPDEAFLAALDPATAQALVPLVDAVADAGLQVDAAFAGLTPAERALLLERILDLDAPGERTLDEQELDLKVAALAERVDVGPLRTAAAGIVAAAESFLATQPAPATVAAPAVPAATTAMGSSCSTGGFSVVSPGGLVEVGFTGSNGYNAERVLIVDLGGDDCYDNYAASYGPGSGIPLPVSVVVDVGGDDVYITDAAHPGGPAGTAWTMGTAIGGVGVLVDRWGNDRYLASLNNEAGSCGPYGSDGWQRLYAQGVGILGAGALVDLGGDDRYFADNLNNLVSTSCHWGRVYTFAQGTGARIGVGALLDDTGNDDYSATSWAEGKYDNNAHTHAQGTAASRGIGALVDKEGNDYYSAQADAQFSPATPAVHKGMFAYTFAQGALYGTNEPRSEALSIDVRCRDIEQSLPVVVDTTVCQRVPVIDVNVGLDVCNPNVAGVTTPIKPGGIGVPAIDDLVNVADPIPGVAPVAGVPPCDHPAYAVLVDIQGQDDYFARAGSTDNGFGCDWGSWSGVAAQGSAPAKGIAALVDAALDTGNSFTALADSQGKGCSTLGVRSDTAAQGFGGAFLWDYWDRPPFDPLLVTDLSLGLLVRGGLCGLDLNQPVNQLALDLNDPCPDAWADDGYFADATSDNGVPGLVSWARTYAQGSGNGKLTQSEVPGGPYDAFGVGGLVDLFGNDRHTATAHATSPAAPGTAQEPRVVAQGAGTSAAGVLVDVGDVDDYDAMAFFGPSPGVPVPVVPSWSLPWIVAQADATVENQVSFKFCTPFTCTTQDVFYGAGILVDVFGGPNDTYSQALPMGCAWNGNVPLSPWIWGTVLPPSCAAAVHNPSPTPPPGSQGFILGIDW
jgi:hypothetical protein